MPFELNQVCPGVTHIRDAMGVCMTLIEGEKSALLVDAGYGVEDVADIVYSLIGNKPINVFLTHHHHDHALGVKSLNRLSDCTYSMLPEDVPAWPTYTCLGKRKAVLQQAKAKGLHVDDDLFLSGVLDVPSTAIPGDIDLGGLTARIIDCPGHTPGSGCVLLVERKLLLTGDNWNPCTWLFFLEALGVREYRQNVQSLQAYDFTHVLCPHQMECYPRAKFDAFVDNLTDTTLAAAKPVTIGGYEHINTRQADVTDGQILVFDWNKYRKE